MERVERLMSPDAQTVKSVLRTADGFLVETTYIHQERKHILCISTQVGCAVGCSICTSGLRENQFQFRRSLSSEEIVEECRIAAEDIDFLRFPKPLLFSFMGEGEPFLNFRNVVDAFHLLGNTEWGGPARLAVSTSGSKPELIELLANSEFKLPLKLQVSLHAPTDELRKKIVLRTKPLAEILRAVKIYRSICGRPVEFNYVLLDGVNDTPQHAAQVAEFLGPGRHVKVSRLNSTIGSPYKASPSERVWPFRQVLQTYGLTSEYYETNESGIDSGCGQLAYRRSTGTTPDLVQVTAHL